jgi:glycyl-radical enzyme activating protein
MKGIVTDIQRFSLHDGPGIRTTVFLKGCNMRCAWCHNPETLSQEPQLLLHAEKCIGCGACYAACPNGARSVKDGRAGYDRKRCTACGACADVCFSGALELSGKPMTAEDVMAEVLQDADYYAHSGGGLTLSGGEAMCQADFALEVLRLCREAGVATAVETNLNYPWAALEKALPLLDLVMFDIKHMDDETHRKWTGVSNKTILENARRLLASGVPVIARTPVIPGVTDSEEAIEAIAAFLKGSPNLKSYELLNFNPLGGGKYAGLGMDNAFASARPLPQDRLDKLAEAARSCGAAVHVR